MGDLGTFSTSKNCYIQQGLAPFSHVSSLRPSHSNNLINYSKTYSMLVLFIEVRVCPRIELYLIIKTTKFFRNTLLLLAQIFRTRLISPFAHISLPRPLNLNAWNKLLALHLKMLRLRTAWNRSIFFIIFRYLLGATTSAVLASRGRYCDTTHHPVPCTNLLVCYVWWWQVTAKLHPPCSTT